MEQVAEFYSFQPEYIESFVFVDEWFNLHKKWWQDPEGPMKNQKGYSQQFIDFVNTYIKP